VRVITDQWRRRPRASRSRSSRLRRPFSGPGSSCSCWYRCPRGSHDGPAGECKSLLPGRRLGRPVVEVPRCQRVRRRQPPPGDPDRRAIPWVHLLRHPVPDCCRMAAAAPEDQSDRPTEDALSVGVRCVASATLASAVEAGPFEAKRSGSVQRRVPSRPSTAVTVFEQPRLDPERARARRPRPRTIAAGSTTSIAALTGLSPPSVGVAERRTGVPGGAGASRITWRSRCGRRARCGWRPRAWRRCGTRRARRSSR
jgi:hypothetical protein